MAMPPANTSRCAPRPANAGYIANGALKRGLVSITDLSPYPDNIVQKNAKNIVITIPGRQ